MKPTLYRISFALFFVSLLVFGGCQSQQLQTQPGTTDQETIEQQVDHLDTAEQEVSANDDLDSLDGDLNQVQEDLNA